MRDEQKPTASVVLGLQPGRVLEANQIAGVVHLVSSSVPELTPANVSVIDQDGNLLSQQTDGQNNAGLDPSQLRYVRELEAGYNKRIEAILSPIVGVGNVHAQVAADIDFSQTDQVAESYKPNPPPETAIRSQQTSETSAGGAGGAGGVPGALTNQPAPAATAPITSAPATTPAAGAGTSTAASTSAAQNVSRNSTINYEVDKTIRHTKEMPGVVRRLSVAVVVNQKRDASKGPNAKPVALTDKELGQMTELAREAMGYNKERGDSLNVTNALFDTSSNEAVADIPFYQNPNITGKALWLFKYAIFIGIAFLLWTRLLQPLFANLSAMAQKGREDARGNNQDDSDEPSRGGEDFDAKINGARQIANSDPKLVANLIKEWVGGGES